MNIDELTIKDIKQIQLLFPVVKSEPLLPVAVESVHPFKIGANYFIRTVSYHHTGRLVQVTETELVLEDAAWIADSGRFSEALQSCDFSEVEMFPKGQVIVGRGALVDAVEIATLPVATK